MFLSCCFYPSYLPIGKLSYSPAAYPLTYYHRWVRKVPRGVWQLIPTKARDCKTSVPVWRVPC